MCSEKKMTYFMRDRESGYHRGIGAGLRREPVHAVDVHRRELPLGDPGIDKGITELKLSTSRRDTRQADQAKGQLRGFQRDFAHLRIGWGCTLSAHQPCHVDAGGGQDPGRRTQSNRLIRRRHHPTVVHAHLDARPACALAPRRGKPTHLSLLRNLRTVFRRSKSDTGVRADESKHQCSRDCVSHHATVRPAGECLNALEVTRGETLVTSG